VAAYGCSTIGAFPYLLLVFKESANAVLPDIFQVFNHAHPVIFSVAFVDSTESLAGEIIAFVAVFYLTVQQQVASLFEESAVFISWPATGTVRHPDALAFYVIFIGKVSTANGAVHTTGSNQYLIH